MKNQFYIKTFQVFNSNGEPLGDPVLVEQVFGSFENYRLYDTSVLHRGRKLYYFKRLFKEDVDEMDGASDGGTGSNDGSQLEPHAMGDDGASIAQDDVSQQTQTRSRKALKNLNAANRFRAAQRGGGEGTRQERDRKLLRQLEKQKVRLQLFSYDFLSMVE